MTHTLFRRRTAALLLVLSNLWWAMPADAGAGTGSGSTYSMTDSHLPLTAVSGDPFSYAQQDVYMEAVGDGTFETGPAGGFFGEVGYLLLRPSFSEAVAFARGTQTPTTFSTTAEPIDFDYGSSWRTTLGYRTEGGTADVRFTYWLLQGDVGVDGEVGGPGQFLVDPFGNLVGAVAIIDPSDARGVGTVLMGGDRIATRTALYLNVFDLDFGTTASMQLPNWRAHWSAGVRVADVRQFYDSIVSLEGTPISGGEYTADFVGAGPRLGVELERQVRRLELFASAHGSLLLGNYHVASTVNPMMQFEAGQSERMKRIIPVLESEVGARWRINRCASISAGWLFQSWIDLGASGGHFGGFFNGADDANIMSFDGLHAQVEFKF